MARTRLSAMGIVLLGGMTLLAQSSPPGGPPKAPPGMAPPGMMPPGMTPPGMAPRTPVTPKVSPQPAREPQYPLLTALLPYVSDGAFKEELKLGDEPAARLFAFRQKLWDDALRTAPADWKAAAPAQNEAVEKIFGEVLSRDQLKRARQLAARIVWTERSFSRYSLPTNKPALWRVSLMTLARYPELAQALQVNAEQRKLIDSTPSFSTSFLYLTPDQSERAAELLGPPPARTLTAAPDPQTTDRGNRLESRLLALTDSGDVRADIKLTDAQADEMTRLRDEWRANRTKILRESPLAQKQKFDGMAAEAAKRMKLILNPVQLNRLEQIDRRSTLPQEDFYQFPEVSSALGVTDAQKIAILKASNACAESIRKAILAGNDVDAAEAAIRKAVDAKRKAVAAALTSEQRAKAADLLGEPFRGSIFDDRVQSTMNPSAVEFGLYTNELAYLTRNKVVQEELILSEEQLKNLAAAATELEARFPTQVLYSATLRGPDRKAYETRSRAIEKVLNDNLKPAQSDRLHQLMIQARERLLRKRLDVLPVAAAVSYPGVAEAIKLTEAQRDQLINGIDPDAVLTADQKAIITNLKGKMVQGDLSPPTPRTSLFVQHDGRHTHLLEVNWESLKLTPAEVEKLAPVVTRYQIAASPSNVITELGGDKDKLAASIESFDRQVEITLTPEQMNRLKQFKFQEAAAISYRNALARPEARDIALSPAQVARIAAAEADDRQWVRLAMRAADHLSIADNVYMKLREKLDASVLATLSETQRKRWSELMGDPWPEIRKQATFHMGKLMPGSEF